MLGGICGSFEDGKERVSSNLPPLPAIEGNAELKAAWMLAVDATDVAAGFLEPIEKSWISLKSIAPELEADFIMSAIFIFGKLKISLAKNSFFLPMFFYYLDDKSMAPIDNAHHPGYIIGSSYYYYY
uniref:Uncharacterized protein n=1 Tax=Glossina austeni TaxID=7395 RepID=A0A1A9VDS8_GLOAU